ncbi:MAG: cupin domain-containing protein [Oscillospiraceae bacterium]|nr:cupin domain-containing protein [Oscillospiraceae bacterium]
MFTENKNVPAGPAGEGATRKVLSYCKNLMACELTFQKGAVGALHSHPHEQIGYIISGRLVYQEEGQADKILETGDTYYVAPNVVHGVQILEDTKLLDIFTPMREDFV